ncbi:MAG: SDR family oxidoreductase [Chelatococcus sp.]|jgi:NAD(P)-dependent dehydrogenase (short-subunit alcohol dehydrogenase family)|uniref:SDR family NAD(P)-dependent oxidoreductase n=1 Tax=Chelatococcus sp. TaxID=1953771 RepID=UPI0025BAA7E0|nr:SDR family NAD(P)-dependent oxidoreductase [Chelatococcus sp.]MBX3540598.1 SDR family oxidoreductase [Chelatococcus sp.]
MDGTWAGRRIVVAGGCGGIGRALVQALVDRRANPVVLDLAASIERQGVPSGVPAFAFDASDSTSVKEAFAAIGVHCGALDGLVNLVGFTRERLPIVDIPDELWEEVIDGNLLSAFHIARAAMPLLRLGITPAIVNTSSGLALKPTPGYGPYSVSKAGVLALTRLLAQEGAPHIRANAIAPSAVDTAFLRGGTGRGGDEDGKPARLDIDAYLRTVPLARLATVEDVVGPILFLLSNASAYVTGQTLHVNGGLLMV